MNPKDRYMEERMTNKKKRQEDILAAAVRVFVDKGFEQATMKDVAKEANLGIATIFRFFSEKGTAHRGGGRPHAGRGAGRFRVHCGYAHHLL